MGVRSLLGIVALSSAADPLGVTTPQRVYLSAVGSFTRADGTTGRAFDSVLPMDNVDTKYAGETGRASWQQDTTLNSKGFGMVTDLAVATANDIGRGTLAASTAWMRFFPESVRPSTRHYPRY